MEISQTLANILVAMSAAHLLHSLMEPIGMRSKLKRLVTYMDGGSVKEAPINIDTRLKGIGLGWLMVAVVFMLAYWVVSAIDPSAKTAAMVAVGVMIFIELVNTVVIDKYHAEIEVVTKRFKK